MQAFEAIPHLQKRFPIERALMRVTVSLPLTQRADLMQALQGGAAEAVASARDTVVCDTDSAEPAVGGAAGAAHNTAGRKKASAGHHKGTQSGEGATSAIIEAVSYTHLTLPTKA